MTQFNYGTEARKITSMRGADNGMEEMTVAIDHGWSSIKVAPDIIFENKVTEIYSEPPTKQGLLRYNGKMYAIGNGRMGKQATKTENENYYLLTLAAIAKAVKKSGRGIKPKTVNIVAGVPLTRFGVEKKPFRNYLKQRDRVFFEYEGEVYTFNIGKVRIYSQCYAAIVNRLDGINRLKAVDCGSWTLDIMAVKEKVPMPDECRTYEYGLISTFAEIQKTCASKFNKEIDEYYINEVIQTGKTSLPKEFVEVINDGLRNYAKGVEAKLRELKIDVDYGNIVYVGGGALVMRRFGDNQNDRIRYVTDVCANAIGYDFLAKNLL